MNSGHLLYPVEIFSNNFRPTYFVANTRKSKCKIPDPSRIALLTFRGLLKLEHSADILSHVNILIVSRWKGTAEFTAEGEKINKGMINSLGTEVLISP